MAIVTILPEALRDSLTSPTFAVPAGVPRHIRLAMLSSVYPTDPTLTFAISIQQSLDGGATWQDWYGATSVGGQAGQPGKWGAPIDGLPALTVQCDGQSRIVKVVITVNAPFSWGITGEVMAT